VRRLRFRRPRPKLIDVDNPDGDLRGSPVELRLAESELSAAVAEEPNNFRAQTQNRGSAALDALIATAQREEPAAAPQPQVLEIEEIPTQRPLRLSPAGDAQQPARSQRVRQRGGVPNRRRPRPEGQEPRRGEGPRRRPSGGDREVEEPVATLERYSHKNEDGSFTFGYVGADGSFREETRGADCITRGKYGYIDPEGVKREYTYTSGLPCEVGDDDLDLQNIDGDINIEDPVDPRERFRQTQNEQLTDAQIPAAARPRRPIQRRPTEETPVIGEANTFSNFGGNSQRAQLPERRPAPAPTRVAQPSGNALQSLQAIANGEPSSPARPAPARAPVRIAPRPTPARPAQQGTFDFDAELEGFTLNRPSLTFEQSKNSAPSSFQSQLSFNQNTGTFQTNLQQNVQGGQQISLVNNNAPSGVTTAAPQPAPVATTFAATRPSPRPATVFQNSTPRPAPTSFPARANPSPAPQGTKTVPAGTFQLGFEPLNIPDIAAVKVNLPPPTPAQIKIAPTPAPTQKPAPAPTQRPTPAPTQRPTQPPTQRPTPVRITLTEAPRQSQPVKIATTAAPTPAAPVTAAPSAPAAAPSSPAAPANTFFVFQPFSQQPASAPFRTPVNPNAFKVNPAPAQPRPVQPRPVQPQPQAARPQPQVARPVQPARPAPQIPQRVPIPQTAAPQQAAAPQLQFGFSPVQQAQPQRPAQPPRPVQPQQVRPQQAPRPAPAQFQPRPPAFTAFRGQQVQQVQQARPQQQVQARPPPQQFQGRPQTFQQPQLGIPPQLQQQRPGAPQFAQFDSRFAPRPQGQAPGQVQFRPAQFTPGQPQQQPSSQFSVFNPAQQLRGA